MQILKKQLEDLWALAKMKASEVNELKERTKLVATHSQLRDLVSQLEPIVKKTSGSNLLFYIHIFFCMLNFHSIS